MKSGHTITFLLASTLGACGGKAVDVAPESVTVSVAKGLEPTFDAQVLERLKHRLSEAGFVVVQADTPAASAVTFEGELRERREGLTPASKLVEATLRVNVATTLGGSHTARLDSVREVVRPLDVAELERKWAVDALATEIIAWLARHPAVVARAEWLGQRRASSGLFTTRPLADVRHEHAQAHEDACRVEAERLAPVDAESGATCVGSPCGDWEVAAVAPGDRGLVVIDRTRVALFDLASDPSPSWHSPHERVLRVPLQGGTAVELWTASAIHDVFNSADGARLLVHAASTGERRGLVPFDLPRGDTAGAATLLRDDVGFAGALPIAGGAFLTLEDGAFQLYAPSPTRLDAVDMVWPVGDGLVARTEDGMLARLDASGRPTLAVPFEGRIDGIIGAPDGSLYVLQHAEGACTLASLAKETLALSWTVQLETCVGQVVMLPDGRLVGAADGSTGNDTPGDTEVVVVEPTTGKVTVLTRDAFDVLDLRASGSRVAYGRDLGRSDAARSLASPRRQVCWLDVPPRVGPAPPPPPPPAPPTADEALVPP